MHIALITVTYNDGYKFDEWCRWYGEYESIIYRHIIVDNGSTPDYLNQVEHSFPHSTIIKRRTNGGSTNAYNDGIELALTDPAVDAIMLLGNDVRISADDIAKLFDFLYSNPRLGMVAPILLEKDSETVACYGNSSYGWMKFSHNDQGKALREIEDKEKIVDWVSGGVNLAKREFYEKVGLQDPAIFMYYDEMDMSYRSRKCGFIQGVTARAIAWHQHINPPGMTARPPYTQILSSRNRIYLIKKHIGTGPAWMAAAGMIGVHLALYVMKLFDKSARQIRINYIRGIVKGLRGDMDNSFVR